MTGDSGQYGGGYGGKHSRCFLEVDSSYRVGDPKRWSRAFQGPYRAAVTISPAKSLGMENESSQHFADSENLVDVAKHGVYLAGCQQPAERRHAASPLRDHGRGAAGIRVLLQQTALIQQRAFAGPAAIGIVARRAPVSENCPPGHQYWIRRPVGPRPHLGRGTRSAPCRQQQAYGKHC